MSVYPNFKNLSPAELEQEELRFNSKISNAELADEAWEQLANLFDQNSDLKQAYRVSYWRWFVILSWQKVYAVSPEMLLLMMKDQVPAAIFSNVDVLEVLLRYLAQNFYSRDDAGIFINKLKSEFFGSEMVFGDWQGQNIKIKDIISEYFLLNKRGADSIETAEFINKLRQLMFPKDALSYAYVDPDEGVNRFLALINFFQDIDDDKKIRDVLNMFLLPENAPGIIQGENANESLESTAEETGPVPQPATEEKTEVEKNIVQPSYQKIPAVEPQARLTAEQVKSQIEKEFKKDAEGNFENIEGVMQKLAELSEKYNDPRVADMLYFDEESNQFKWSV